MTEHRSELIHYLATETVHHLATETVHHELEDSVNMTASHIGDEAYFVLAQPGSRENTAGRAVTGIAEHNRASAVAPMYEPMRPDRCEVSAVLGSIQEMSGAFAQPQTALTPKELESQILQNYLGVEKNPHFRAGAKRFLAYLEGEQRSLAEVTTRDLQEWARTPMVSGKGNMPSERIFRGAQRLCAFAAQVGHVNAPRAKEISEYKRQPMEATVLRNQLQNRILTSEERATHIQHNYLIAEKNANRQAGANSFMAYLQSQKKSLAEVSTSDLGRWALTPLPRGHFKSNLPNSDAFEGAKGLCALAAEVGYIQAQAAKDLAAYTRPQFDLGTLRTILQNPELTRKEQENHIRLYFQSVDKQHEHQVGARAMLAYLESQGRSLVDVSVSDLERWALTPITSRTGKMNVPSARAFEGAKLLCALAAVSGYIDVGRAKQLAEFKRPQFGLENLRTLLQNPAFTAKEREYQIRLNYQASQNNSSHHAGAAGFLAYLENATIALAEVSTDDLRLWALTPLKGTRNLPEPQAFEGAKELCALAAQVGHIDAQRAQELAICERPRFDVDFLSMVLQNPALTRKEREYQIRLNYQTMDKDPIRQAGAKGIIEYLEKQGRSLSEVTTSDLQHWALTPISRGRAQGNLPNLASFEGAQALCALAAKVGYIDAQRAQNLARCTRPQADIGSLRMLVQNPELTRKERDSQIRLHYKSAEKNANALSGASGFLAYLESLHLSLAEASKSDLERWALTPIATGKSKNYLPSSRAFVGAKALCALAAEVGHLDAQQAQAIATCMRPRFDVDSLRMVLQNPALTRKERECQIRLNYQSSEKNPNSLAGANSFFAYLERQEALLAAVTKSDLEEWALTPLDSGKAKGTLPSQLAFNGAKALCAVAAKIEYIDAQTAQAIAECPRPQFDQDSLRSLLENPALTRKEREYAICLNYQSTEKNLHRQSGTNGFLAYLENQGSSLAAVTKRDLEQWALTPIPAGKGKGTFPSQRSIQGAKAVCALAAEVGYIDAQRAADIAECTFPQPGGPSTRMVQASEAGLPVAESSSAMLERVHKRLRTEDPGASTSMFHSFAFPQSDALLRELVLSPPSLLDLHEDARLTQTGSTLSLIDELESLEDILGSSGQLY